MQTDFHNQAASLNVAPKWPAGHQYYHLDLTSIISEKDPKPLHFFLVPITLTPSAQLLELDADYLTSPILFS